MENRVDILTMVAEKEALIKELKSLTYGSIEIREKDNSRYIYVHFRKHTYLLEYNRLVNYTLFFKN